MVTPSRAAPRADCTTIPSLASRRHKRASSPRIGRPVRISAACSIRPRSSCAISVQVLVVTRFLFKTAIPLWVSIACHYRKPERPHFERPAPSYRGSEIAIIEGQDRRVPLLHRARQAVWIFYIVCPAPPVALALKIDQNQPARRWHCESHRRASAQLRRLGR